MGLSRLSMVILAAVAAVAVVAVAILTMSGSPPAAYVVLSGTDSSILTSAYEEFGALNASMPAVEAREGLMEMLGSRTGVKSVWLLSSDFTMPRINTLRAFWDANLARSAF